MDNFLPASPEVIDLNDSYLGDLLAGFSDAEKLAALTARYEELQSKYNQTDAILLNTQGAYSRQTSAVEAFEVALKEAVQEDVIDFVLAEQFAAIFDISLEKMYEFTVTVEYTFSATIPLDKDPENIVDNLNFTVESAYYSDGIEINDEDANVIHTNYTEM